MGLIWWSSSRARLFPGAETIPSFVHNSGHIFAFGGLAGLVLFAFAGPDRWSKHHARLAVLVAGAYGVVDEVHQSFVPGRSSTVSDVISDVVGGCLAVAILFGVVRGEAAAKRAIWRWAVLAVGAVAFATWGPW
jgi:VanZ family protein